MSEGGLARYAGPCGRRQTERCTQRAGDYRVAGSFAGRAAMKTAIPKENSTPSDSSPTRWSTTFRGLVKSCPPASVVGDLQNHDKRATAFTAPRCDDRRRTGCAATTWGSQNETACRVQGRIERGLDAARARGLFAPQGEPNTVARASCLPAAAASRNDLDTASTWPCPPYFRARGRRVPANVS